MKDYYSVLQVSKEAAASEIKKAYFGLVRKYPPDRYPEKFMQIREAYEILIDGNTRRQYDAMEAMPDIVKLYYYEAKKALEEGDSERAVSLLERVVEVYPDISLVNSLLGDAYLENGNSGKALQVFEELTAKEPGNAGFAGKLAHACLMRGWHKKAVEKYHAALELDEDNISLWLGLVKCHLQAKEPDRAREVALEGIDVSKRKGWDSLELYYHIILADVHSLDKDSLKKHLEEMKGIALRNEDEKGNVAWFLATLAKQMQVYGLNDISSAAISTAFELLPEDGEIKKIHSEIKKERILLSQVEKLKTDGSFHGIFADMVDFEMHKCGNRDCLNCEFEQFAFEMDVLMDIDSLRTDIIRLKTAYPELYALKSEFFNNVLNRNKIQSLMFSYRKRMERYMRLCPEKFADDDDEDDEYYPRQPARRDENKVGRNDPCPCGSGKKYKKCCGR